jgi:hypothetical protein
VTNQGSSLIWRSIVDYIVGSLVVWQVATHLEVLIDDTHYCAMGVDSDHRLLCLRLNIDCSLLSHNIWW